MQPATWYRQPRLVPGRADHLVGRNDALLEMLPFIRSMVIRDSSARRSPMCTSVPGGRPDFADRLILRLAMVSSVGEPLS